jgi:hypothetical protein
MSFNISSVRRKMPLLLALAGTAVFSQFASASYIDHDINVTYELTSTFTPELGTNTYDVYLALDATHFSQPVGYLVAVALQFQKDQNNNPPLVSLVDAPGGAGDWSLSIQGGTDAGGCKPGNADFECFQFSAADNASAVPASEVYVFHFAVTLPGTTALIATNDIKAVYDLNRDGSGRGVLGQTSQSLNIDPCSGNGCGQINPNGPNTPEPGTMVMMLSGMGLVGIGAFRKLRS